MAHKKAGGSSRNGRDSQSKRLFSQLLQELFSSLYAVPRTALTSVWLLHLRKLSN